ncbi:MAG: hypothetical protein HC897_08290, partial [Thermoanaerobaculia bacterium]|nr:hypothetical protein [Thermoanaerobaculia bacterium]
MSQPEPFFLEGATPIYGEVDLPAQPGPRPTVVICHGFKGFFEWGFFPPLATLLAERGFTVVRFNYSGSGMKPGASASATLPLFAATPTASSSPNAAGARSGGRA